MPKKKVLLVIFLLPLVSALLLSLPFLVEGVWFIALIALLPLLAAEEIATRRGIRGFWVIYYLAFLIWNLLTTWWVYLATPPGSHCCLYNQCPSDESGLWALQKDAQAYRRLSAISLSNNNLASLGALLLQLARLLAMACLGKLLCHIALHYTMV